ncbi:MAG: tRNA (adenosine(37)-N6)-dimethylallyltransferase MiaA [Bacteroidetes bacterium]|nr:tRNA (adenosine(37)-N6)-dimethylallyltransferase MiaA [Bacteroidota bacterium]
MNPKKTKTLIVITGPTAVGKTAMAIRIAQHFATEIISADSRQFYKELNIGVAKPSNEELAAATHHFIGNISITEAYNVSKFETEALLCLENIFQTKDAAVLVGGSGLYIDAVCKGIDELPDPDEELREDIKQLFAKEGIEALRSRLKVLDPDYYHQVDLANPKRIMRALEVCLCTGKPFSSLRLNQQEPRLFNIIKIGLNRKREDLYEMINKRVDIMLETGLLDEARAMLPYQHLNALNTVGYKELFAYFNNEYSLNQAIDKIKVNSRRYAKRQLTWFTRYNDIEWFEADKPDEILDYLDVHLK